MRNEPYAMSARIYGLTFMVVLVLLNTTTLAAEGIVTSNTTTSQRNHYAPAKVVYDVASARPENIKNILDRISMLQGLYDTNPFEAAIVVVLHEGAIPFFVKGKNSKHTELVDRARSLTMGEVIQFRMCRASAKMQGFQDKDIHDFVAMVPMADAEIIKLQHEGYALMH